MLFFTRKHKQQTKDIGKMVEAKALEHVRVQAQAATKDYLCLDCLDKRCLTGSECKAFLTLTDSVAWEIIAKNTELN